jgi:tetratricopeptide (TPR) repeat protein
MNYGGRTTAALLAFAALTCSPFDFVYAQSSQEQLSVARTEGLKEYRLGHFTEAIRLLQNAMALAVQANDAYHTALIHNDLGDIYQDEYEFTNAEQEFNRAIHILRQQPQHPQALAVTLGNLGGMLCKRYRYAEALAVVSEASKLVKDNAIHDLQLQVHLLDVSATAYFQQRQFKKAEPVFLQALRAIPESATIPEAMDISNNLGTLYATKRNYPEAVASYARALAIGERCFGPSHPNITTILGNLGFAYMHMRRYHDAEAQFLRSLTILEENRLTRSPMAMNVLYSLGRIAMEENQLERAQSLLARAVEIGHAIRARTPEMAETLDLYSVVLRHLSNRSEADNLHAEAALIRAEMALTTRVGH